MALDSDSAIHILLTGPPASAKTMFLTSLMQQLKNSYFAVANSAISQRKRYVDKITVYIQ
jgi:tRNA uridine 5-carbamoylmethylation protein Kti12